MERIERNRNKNKFVIKGLIISKKHLIKIEFIRFSILYPPPSIQFEWQIEKPLMALVYNIHRNNIVDIFFWSMMIHICFFSSLFLFLFFLINNNEKKNQFEKLVIREYRWRFFLFGNEMKRNFNLNHQLYLSFYWSSSMILFSKISI